MVYVSLTRSSFCELLVPLRRTLSAGSKPDLQPVEVEIDDRSRVERQQLAERKSTDHRVTQRLTQLRAGASAYGERQSRQKGHSRRHQNGTEAQKTGLADGRNRRES